MKGSAVKGTSTSNVCPSQAQGTLRKGGWGEQKSKRIGTSVVKCHLIDMPLQHTADLTAAGVNNNRPAKDQVSHSPWKGTDYRQTLCLTKQSLTVEKVAAESVPRRQLVVAYPCTDEQH